MPPKGSIKLNEKRKQIGKLASKRKTVSSLEETLNELDQEINTLEHRLNRKKARIEKLKENIDSISETKEVKLFPIVSIDSVKRRRKNPTTEGLSTKSRQRRRNETDRAAKAIHGSTDEHPFAALHGMVDTLTAKYPVSVVSNYLMNSKAALKKTLEQKFQKDFKSSYYHSEKNKMRSLNVYYGHSVLGKRKYISLLKSNKNPDMSNYVSYKILSKMIRDVDIGTVISVIPTLTENLPQEETGEGMFRDLRSYALRLVEFYLKVDKHRVDKLKTFEKFDKKDPSSTLFLMCIGGDEAPLAGTSFLISFLNVGKRIASSFENYLIFGANVKENSGVVKRYLKILLKDIRYLENSVFSVTVDNKVYNIEFKLQGLPNDMKMLSFLAGELTNSALYFTTFANVSQHDSIDINKTFSFTGNTSWKPFDYAKRIKDASLVSKKVLELEKKNVKETTCRTLLTSYISNQLKSRQEKVPLMEEYIDLARCEPLHLKNNCTKELFMKILDIVISEAKLPSNVKNFKDVPELNIFHQFIVFVKTDMNSNFLAKKLIAWFNENKESKQERIFGFRFRGQESANYLQSFPSLIDMVKNKVSSHATVC